MKRLSAAVIAILLCGCQAAPSSPSLRDSSASSVQETTAAAEYEE